MVFSSAVFLFIFLPASFLLHTVLPNIRAKNALLTIASLIFYAFGEPVYVLLMLLSVLINYVFGLIVSAQKSKTKLALICGISLNLLILFVFKYIGFITSSINSLFSISFPVPEIRLPIGISFFTFQAMSYVIDVYRDPSLCQKNFGRLMLYISFFPQLIAGPIVKYSDIEKELNCRNVSLEDAAQGLRRFIVGLSKKLLIANTLGYASDAIFSQNGISMLPAWAGAVFYMLQIYYDFSGYSDMAIGLGHAFGFHFKENFNFPYSAVGIKDFWRRWHISLSGWFRDYLYIPLGGNRRGRCRTIFNKYIVFFLTGLWHGASWNFVLWGLIHGTLLVLEDTTPLSRLREKPIIGRVYTILAIMLAFVLFRADTLSDGFSYLSNMFHASSTASLTSFLPLLTPWFIFIAVIAVIFAFPVKKALATKQKSPIITSGAYVLSFVLYVLCILNLASSTFNPFIYFRF